MLILTKAPVPELQGMSLDSPLAPGHPPPWLVPHCRSCGVPVEEFTIDYVSSEWHLPIQWRCCGRTGGLKVPRDQALYASRHGGGLIYVNQPALKAVR